METLIRVRDVSLGFSGHVTLKEVSFDVPRRGVFALMGPAGVGKSTLLRTLGRWNDLRPAFWCHGNIFLGEEDLLAMPSEVAQRRVALLAQKARLYTASVLDNVIAEVRGDERLSRRGKLELARDVLEPLGLWARLALRLDRPVVDLSIAAQRMLAVARLISGGAECLLADEPMRDIDPNDKQELLSFFARLGRRMAVVLVTHDQGEARLLSDNMCLFSGHRLVETGKTSDFFSCPQTKLGRTFLESGSCWPENASTPPLPTSEQDRPSWAPTMQESAYRPGGFHWVLPELLAGMQRPGLLGELTDDLGSLQQMGVRTIVTLTEEPFDSTLLAPYGITSWHFPIIDMDVPPLVEAARLCHRLEAAMMEREPVVLHCKAGLGRTGTMLACMLVFRGESALKAIHRVRSVNPLYIQSDKQLKFIADFEQFTTSARLSETGELSEAREG